MTKSEAKKMERVQFLIGKALGDYLNDRNPNRASDVCNALEAAFQIVVKLRSSQRSST